ncbi:hypothetical protein BDZ85DRAFT_302633 [Elsinoe ampelina]|uniref:Uncharacterized protein n=1 Tax=Elsinoe ampelina TaxID=302913 RepID=A0A6A6G6C7_9PEZI|nr:hypothetical protein BDZ85DRAFT_302633 [Elsinoe ampelina]
MADDSNAQTRASRKEIEKLEARLAGLTTRDAALASSPRPITPRPPPPSTFSAPSTTFTFSPISASSSAARSPTSGSSSAATPASAARPSLASTPSSIGLASSSSISQPSSSSVATPSASSVGTASPSSLATPSNSATGKRGRPSVDRPDLTLAELHLRVPGTSNQHVAFSTLSLQTRKKIVGWTQWARSKKNWQKVLAVNNVMCMICTCRALKKDGCKYSGSFDAWSWTCEYCIGSSKKNGAPCIRVAEDTTGRIYLVLPQDIVGDRSAKLDSNGAIDYEAHFAYISDEQVSLCPADYT